MIDVIDKHVVRDFYYVTMHGDVLRFSAFGAAGAIGIESVASFCSKPFVFFEAVVVVGVYDGVFSLGQGDSAEGIAETEASVEEQDRDEGSGQGCGDVESQVYWFAAEHLQSPLGALAGIISTLSISRFQVLSMGQCGPLLLARLARLCENCGFYPPAGLV